MYHGVPMAGDFSHGLVSYHPKFFTRLQEVNGYEIIARWIWADGEACSYDLVELAHVGCPFVAQDAGYISYSAGSGRDAFVAPTDLVEDHMRIQVVEDSGRLDDAEGA